MAQPPDERPQRPLPRPSGARARPPRRPPAPPGTAEAPRGPSGGSPLTPTVLIASYDAGTDTMLLHTPGGRVLDEAEFERLVERVRRFYRLTPTAEIDRHNDGGGPDR